MAETADLQGTQQAPEGAGAATAALVTGGASTEDLAALRREAAQAKASQQRADKAEKELKSLRDEAEKARLAAAPEGPLQAQLKSEQEARRAAERKAELAEIKATYPLVHARLGDEARKLSVEKLAGLEEDFKAARQTEPQAPIGLNQQRTVGSAQPPKPESSADIMARLKAMPRPANWGG